MSDAKSKKSQSPVQKVEKSEKTFGVLEMTVSKKELVDSVINVKVGDKEEAIYKLRDELEEMEDMTTLITKEEKDKIEAEVMADPKVKALVDAHTALYATANEPRTTKKVGAVVDVNFRQGHPNIAVTYSAKYTTLYFGTCEERFQSGTFDLKTISPTAKAAVKKVEDHIAKVEAKEKEIEKEQKALEKMQRAGSRIKLGVNLAIVKNDPQASKLLAEVQDLVKSLE